MFTRPAILWTALALAAGCAAEPQTSGQLLDRLNSAERISTPGPRERALSDIARDSADAAQQGLCLRAIDAIEQVPLHDQTAEACAAKFDALGDRPTADTVVGRIVSGAVRDRLRIAYADHPAPARTSAY